MNGEYITIETAKQKAVYDRNLKQKIEYKNRIDKAVEYCKNNKEYTPRLVDIIKILDGSDDNE